eukprot:TRINITY_DN2655_c0_g1_i2.p1 TRINITY_DN2655_c0_g1~~TRINITY_DN2655_c0_g1_i2.p1  ORF type:complete len:342 (-),score=29.99 TRINITY_DN2655_c0_g1_i2:19-1044(-)
MFKSRFNGGRFIVGFLLLLIHQGSAIWHVSYRYDQGSLCTNATQFSTATGITSGYCRDFATDYRQWQCEASPPKLVYYSRTAAQCGANPVSSSNLVLDTCSASSFTQISRCTSNPLPFPGQEFVLLLSFTAVQNCNPNSIESASQFIAYAAGKCYNTGGSYYQRYRCQDGTPISLVNTCTSPTCECGETTLSTTCSVDSTYNVSSTYSCYTVPPSPPIAAPLAAPEGPPAAAPEEPPVAAPVASPELPPTSAPILPPMVSPQLPPVQAPLEEAPLSAPQPSPTVPPSGVAPSSTPVPTAAVPIGAASPKSKSNLESSAQILKLPLSCMILSAALLLFARIN